MMGEENQSADAASTGSSEVDEKTKKKLQNSLRWKRWWSKNRESYNEKRRISAQQKSARTRAERARRLQTASDQVEGTKIKRSRRSEEETADSQVANATPRSDIVSATPPTISPRFGLHDIMSPDPMEVSRSFAMNSHLAGQPTMPVMFKVFPPVFNPAQQTASQAAAPRYLMPMMQPTQMIASHQLPFQTMQSPPLMHRSFFPPTTGTATNPHNVQLLPPGLSYGHLS